MAWENGYDIPGGSGDGNPLDLLRTAAPQVGDVLSAAGAGAGSALPTAVSPSAGSPLLHGAAGYAGYGRNPAPGSRYPALGFDPAPGDLAEVGRLVTVLTHAADRLGHAQGLVKRMQDDQDSWQGQAAEAFHDKLSENLPKYLDEGLQSLSKAAHTLKGWQGRLDTRQATARGHETDAESARSTYRSAWHSAVTIAADNKSSLALQGKHFESDAQLADANAKIKAATGAVEDAAHRAASAYTTLQQVISEARSLADAHSSDAGDVARSLRAEAKDFAPHKPSGLWSKISGWLEEHGGDILSAAAAVCGVIALFCPVFALPAILLSVGALAMHAWKFADKGKAAFFPVGKNLGNWLALGGDALGAVPGALVAMDGIKAMRVASAAEDGLSLAGKGGALWHGVTEAGEKLGGDGAVSSLVQKPVTRLVDGTWSAAHTASDNAQFVGKAVQFHVNAPGAAYSLASLDPQAAGDSSFANVNNSVGAGGSGVGAAGSAWDLIDKIRR
jgi:hypothetical protein